MLIKKIILAALPLVSLLGIATVPAFSMQAVATPVCYPYGTPNTQNSGSVCPFVSSTGTSIPTAAPTIAPTLAPTITSVPTLTSPTGLSINWIVADEIGLIPDDVGRAGNNVIFLNSYTGDGLAQFPQAQYGTADFTGIIPADSKGVFLTGLLIITHGTTAETCDLQVFFRKNSSTPEWNYIGQTLEASVGDGQRTPMFAFVPVENGKLQMMWKGNTFTAGNYPAHCAYGINYKLTGYVR